MDRIPDWKAMAEAKAADTLSRIPRDWVLKQSDRDNAIHERQLCGSFIEKYLDGMTLGIVRNDSLSLITKIKEQKYTAEQVIRSYCKTAAIAHQIVGYTWPWTPKYPSENGLFFSIDFDLLTWL